MGCAFDGMIPISPIVDCVTGPSATCPDGKRPLPPRSLSSLPIRTDVTRCPCALEARFVDSLLCTQYEDTQAFTILALLAPNVDDKNGGFHKDHNQRRS